MELTTTQKRLRRWEGRAKKRGQARYGGRVAGLVRAVKDRPCMDCGGRFPVECMDLDHVRGEKSFALSRGTGKRLDAVLAEIEKCEVVCSNCHRIRTHRRRQEKKVDGG